MWGSLPRECPGNIFGGRDVGAITYPTFLPRFIYGLSPFNMSANLFVTLAFLILGASGEILSFDVGTRHIWKFCSASRERRSLCMCKVLDGVWLYLDGTPHHTARLLACRMVAKCAVCQASLSL